MFETMTDFIDSLMNEIEDGPLDEEVRGFLFEYLGRAYEYAQVLESRENR